MKVEKKRPREEELGPSRYSEEETQSADAFIGDYAPIGVYTTERQFLESNPSPRRKD